MILTETLVTELGKSLGVAYFFFFSIICLILKFVLSFFLPDYVTKLKAKRNRFWSAIFFLTIALIFSYGFALYQYRTVLGRYAGYVTLFGFLLTAWSFLYFYDFFILMGGNSFFVRAYLKECEDILDHALYLEQGETLKNKKWYIIRKIDLNSYYILLAKYYRRINDHLLSIEVLEKIDKTILNNQELLTVEFLFGINYVEVGAYARAEIALKNMNRIIVNGDSKKNPDYWLLKAYLDDSKGELDNALSSALNGLNITSSNDHYLKCQLNNCISRFYSLKNDEQNALHYMRMAKREVENVKSINYYLISNIYSNLILMLVRIDSTNPEIERLRSEYYDIVHKNLNLESLISYQNLVLEMFRQSGERNYYNIIIKGYNDTIEYIIKHYGKEINEKRICNEVSTLRMLLHGTFKLDLVSKDIFAHFKYYDALPLKHKVFIYVELYSLIEQMDIPNQQLYKDIFTSIKDFLVEEGLKVIDNMVNSLPEYNVLEYLKLVRTKIHILKIKDPKGSIDTICELHKGLVNKCKTERLFKQQTIELMLWIDYMISPETWDMKDEFPPLLVKHKDILEEAEQLFNKFRNYDNIFEFAIQLSSVYLILNDANKSKEYLQVFIDTNVDVHHYASWFRLKYYNLLLIHGFTEKIDKQDFLVLKGITYQSSIAKDLRLGNSV